METWEIALWDIVAALREPADDPVGAVPGASYRIEVLGGNALLDPETLECLAGFAART